MVKNKLIENNNMIAAMVIVGVVSTMVVMPAVKIRSNRVFHYGGLVFEKEQQKKRLISFS